MPTLADVNAARRRLRGIALHTPLEPSIELAEASGAASRGSLEVRIRADRSVPYQIVEPLMLACAKAGIADLTFAVTPSH